MNRRKEKKRVPWLVIVRRAVQIVAFILMPGLFISAFSSVKTVYMAAVGGTFEFAALLPELITIVAVVGTTMLLGRFFCGFLCSFGAMGDFISFLSRLVRKKPVAVPEKADRILKLLKYALLIWIVVFIWTLGVKIDNSLNPWNIFGMYTSLAGWTSLGGWLTVGALLLLLIMIGSFFIERFFCRYFCPLGVIFAIVSRLRVFKVKKPRENCKTCRVCSNHCVMGIPLYKYDEVGSGECINCFECIRACPRKNARAAIAGKDAAPMAAGVAAAAAIMGLCYVGKIVPGNTVTEAATPIATGQEAGAYVDGTYTGSARGYRGTTTVQVTVENGYISDIRVLSTDDDSEFFSRAESAVINAIIGSQSPQVDAVTGATYSSSGIMDAVADALSMTVAAETETATESPAAEETQVSGTEEPAQAAAGTYTDGVYTGIGTGFRGETEVSVTVSGGRITDIGIVSYLDDAQYFERASAVIDEIIGAQSVDVDTVSGATFSSNGILEAVADALSVDFSSPNTTVQEQEGGHGGHGGHG